MHPEQAVLAVLGDGLFANLLMVEPQGHPEPPEADFGPTPETFSPSSVPSGVPDGQVQVGHGPEVGGLDRLVDEVEDDDQPSCHDDRL